LRLRFRLALGSGFQDSRPFPRPSGYRPEACASADCSGLAAFASCGCQLPQGLWTSGLSILTGLAPFLIRPLACSLVRSACASRRLGTGLLVLPRRPLPAACRLAPAFSSRVSRSRMDALASPHPSGAFRTVLEASACASASCPALPDLPSGSEPPVPGLRPARLARPSSLPSLPPSGLRPPVSAPAPPRARSAI